MTYEEFIKATSSLPLISRNKNGGYYFIYKIPVKRGIRGKNKAVVNEVIIVGMNKDRVREYCKKQGIDIEKLKDGNDGRL